MTSTDLLSSAVVGAVAGAAASLLNGWLQRKSALQVARVSLIMPMREAWIGKLREKLAFHMGVCTQVVASPADIDEKDLRQLAVTRAEIALMLNLEEKSHSELIGSLNTLELASVAERAEHPEFDRFLDRAQVIARAVLKSEWQRTQEGK